MFNNKKAPESYDFTMRFQIAAAIYILTAGALVFYFVFWGAPR